MQTFTFKHSYYKLSYNRFTTIRGRSWAKKIKSGDVVEILSPVYRGKALVEDVRDLAIGDFALEQLKTDGEYNGFEINSHADFITLLNSFRKPWMPVVDSQTVVCIFTLQKIIDGE